MLKAIFGGIAIILIVKSLAALVLSFILIGGFLDNFRLSIFALYLVGEVGLGLLCYFAPENNPVEDFLYINHQCAAFSSVIILLNVLFYEFPDYTKINNFFAAFLLIVCAFILGSFFKVQRKREGLEKRRQTKWWK